MYPLPGCPDSDIVNARPCLLIGTFFPIVRRIDPLTGKKKSLCKYTPIHTYDFPFRHLTSYFVSKLECLNFSIGLSKRYIKEVGHYQLIFPIAGELSQFIYSLVGNPLVKLDAYERQLHNPVTPTGMSSLEWKGIHGKKFWKQQRLLSKLNLEVTKYYINTSGKKPIYTTRVIFDVPTKTKHLGIKGAGHYQLVVNITTVLIEV